LTKRFVSEAITPVVESFDSAAMTHGEPGLPSSFAWRERTIDVANVAKVWRTLREDRGDQYLARHWYEIEDAAGTRFTIYFDRQAKAGKPRWWLYTLEE
jgi:hypothetical protein